MKNILNAVSLLAIQVSAENGAMLKSKSAKLAIFVDNVKHNGDDVSFLQSEADPCKTENENIICTMTPCIF